jgi:hypothetical protein
MLVFGAYFGSRTLEKVTEIRSKKWHSYQYTLL